MATNKHAKETGLWGAGGRGGGLLTPRSKRAGFQNCESIHSCCLDHPVYGTLSPQPSTFGS